MPMDGHVSGGNWQDRVFYDRAIWYLEFTWLPRKCALSRKLIWFTRAYRGLVMYSGPGEPVMEFRWINKNEFIMAKLRGII